jgi:hypothetical protein
MVTISEWIVLERWEWAQSLCLFKLVQNIFYFWFSIWCNKRLTLTFVWRHIYLVHFENTSLMLVSLITDPYPAPGHQPNIPTTARPHLTSASSNKNFGSYCVGSVVPFLLN